MKVGQPFLFSAGGPSRRVLLDCCKTVGVIEFNDTQEIDKNPNREEEVPLLLRLMVKDTECFSGRSRRECENFIT